MNFFLPKQNIFFDLLRRLNVHSQEIAQLFTQFAESFDNFKDFSRRAKEIEHRADSVTHEIIERLNRTFVTPFDREDIYLLAHELDDIVDLIENVVHNIEIYQITERRDVVCDFAKLIAEASRDLDELMHHFQERKNIAHPKQLIVKIHELEDRGDELFQEAIHRLFSEENDPVLIIKWKDILENLERIMDKYQKVSDIIEGIIVKFS